MDEGGENLLTQNAMKRAQLALALRTPPDLTEARFVAAASNARARTWLAQTGWPERRLWLWGPEGCGKTHLLHVWAQRRGALVLDARTLDWEKAERAPRIAIDHVERVQDERALLHLLNAARERRASLLLAGRVPPARLAIALPDLASRLRAVATVAIAPPEDSLRATLLLRLLAERQLIVSQPVTDWLWRNLPRTGSAILEAVERLDHAGLAHGRPVTRILAQEVLADILAPEEISDEA
ncbi:DnaA/Hda family protein [Kozakia baliensis]|uniref:DnaA/Hda family protein n=1 Tax=Kozakia baliensis TaxID=153496 RepID=UPI0004981168|nr:chromosomal replication initiator protein DnaA [Kozakia baliensis]